MWLGNATGGPCHTRTQGGTKRIDTGGWWSFIPTRRESIEEKILFFFFFIVVLLCTLFCSLFITLFGRLVLFLLARLWRCCLLCLVSGRGRSSVCCVWFLALGVSGRVAVRQEGAQETGSAAAALQQRPARLWLNAPM